MPSVAFNLGPLTIRWYSLFILIGVLLAYIVIKREANRFKLPSEFMLNLLFWTFIVGVIGARVYYVIFNFGYYKSDLLEIFKVWHGGLAIHGGIIAGAITIYIYCSKYGINVIKTLDIAVPGLIIAQAIGRWGNFFNNEAYGSVIEYEKLVNLKVIPQFIIDNMNINGNYHLPMFYFESIACLIGFIIILIIRRRKYIKRGQILAFYLIWYGVVRFVIEIYRTDSLMFLNMKMAQLVSVFMVIIGAYIMSVQAKKPTLEELYNSTDDMKVAF